MIIALVLFALLCALVVAANAKYHFDPDIGGYKPEWKNKAAYPKAFVHAVVAFAIVLALPHVPINPLHGSIILAIFLVPWELGQGFINWKDIIAGLVGISLALALIYL